MLVYEVLVEVHAFPKTALEIIEIKKCSHEQCSIICLYFRCHNLVLEKKVIINYKGVGGTILWKEARGINKNLENEIR